MCLQTNLGTQYIYIYRTVYIICVHKELCETMYINNCINTMCSQRNFGYTMYKHKQSYVLYFVEILKHIHFKSTLTFQLKFRNTS